MDGLVYWGRMYRQRAHVRYDPAMPRDASLPQRLLTRNIGHEVPGLVMGWMGGGWYIEQARFAVTQMVKPARIGC